MNKTKLHKLPTSLVNICLKYEQIEIEGSKDKLSTFSKARKDEHVRNVDLYHSSITFAGRTGYKTMMHCLINKYENENDFLMLSQAIDQIVNNTTNRFVLSFFIDETKPMERDNLMSRVYFHVRDLILEERFEEFYEMASYFSEFKKIDKNQRIEYEKYLKVHANNKPMYLEYINSNWSDEHFKSFFQGENERIVKIALKYKDMGLVDLDDYLSPNLCYRLAYHIFEQINNDQQ